MRVMISEGTKAAGDVYSRELDLEVKRVILGSFESHHQNSQSVCQTSLSSNS
jgi:hypothetical protein